MLPDFAKVWIQLNVKARGVRVQLRGQIWLLLPLHPAPTVAPGSELTHRLLHQHFMQGLGHAQNVTPIPASLGSTLPMPPPPGLCSTWYVLWDPCCLQHPSSWSRTHAMYGSCSSQSQTHTSYRYHVQSSLRTAMRGHYVWCSPRTAVGTCLV